MNARADDPMLSAALDYARAGWQVFPCSPDDKRPLLPKESEPGARDGGLWLATTDAETVRGWWRVRRGAMIGVRMGTGCGAFAVDFDPVDDPHTGEVVTFEDLLLQVESIIGEPLPPTLTSETPRGGRHMFFSVPDGVSLEDIGNSRGVLPKHVDLRGNGGYVIVAPSVRHGRKAIADRCDGIAYRWIDQDATIAVAPQSLIDAIQRKGRFAHQARPTSGFAPQPRLAVPSAFDRSEKAREARERYGHGALAKIKAEAASTFSKRGSAMFKAACAAGRLVAARAISEREALASLMDAAEANGLLTKDGQAKVEREIVNGLQEGASDATDVIKRVEEIEREAEERAARYAPSSRPVPPPADYADLPDYGPARDARADARPDHFGDATDVAPDPSAGLGKMPEWEPGESDEDGCDRPSRQETVFDSSVIVACSKLDHSDTDNGQRLRLHFGDDLKVMQRRGVLNREFLAWVGTHWDLDTGQDKAFALAQDIGGLIGLEADYLAHTPQELRDIETGDSAAAELDDLNQAIEKMEADIKAAGRADKPDREAIETIEAKRKAAWARRRTLDDAVEKGKAAKAALEKRQVARRKFGVSSKNKARLDAMLACAAPWLTVKPEKFNADPFRVATASHTLVFRREVDPENPDPDGTRYIGTLEAMPTHCQEDLITFLVPSAYEHGAGCPKWLEFMERFLPVPAVRRFFQVYAGLGLLGETVQKLVFNYGDGANGKSVAMQTIFNVLGDLAVNLEPESITGVDTKAGGAASPDLIRLFGKRFLRISELPRGEPLKEALVKKITGGGEELSVRGLFQGMIDFVPTFVAMMSGNDYPRIDGTDHGIWRRIAVVHWPVKIPDEEQRPFNEVIDSFRPEYSGILNWLIEGARIYLTEGLVVPAEVRAATAEYQRDMDPTADFVEACVEKVDGHTEMARVLYEGYVSWCMANRVKPIHETRFGRIMKGKFPREDGRIRTYRNCRLHDVPERPEAPSRSPAGWGDNPQWDSDPVYDP